MGTRERGIKPSEALEINEILERLNRIDLAKLAEEKEEAKSDTEKLIEGLASNRKVGRVIAGKKRVPAGNNHWKRKRKRAREYARKVAPMKRARIAESLKTPEGWWEFVMRGWKKRKGVIVYLTYEEFVEHVYPWIEKGHVPVFRRLNPNRGLSLDNLLVRDTHGKVLFDGSQHKLERLGYVLPPEVD